jgi:methylmalonyl-CoA mutase cobalamin-binding subunit
MAHDGQKMQESIRGLSAVGSLAIEVVSVLNARQGRVQRGVARPYIGAILEKRVISRASFDARAALDELRAFRLTDEEIIDQYIPAAAVAIGHKWLMSELSFAEVTIAIVRLQSLLNETAHSYPNGDALAQDTLECLMVTLEGDQHTLGGFVAATQLRRRGAVVEMSCGEPDAEIRARITGHAYDVVMFSCSRERDLESIAQIVKYSRQRGSTTPVFALGGIVCSAVRGLDRLTGVDIATSDIDEVLAYCGQRSNHSLMRAVR